MWRIFILLFFAREALACDCPGITIKGTDQDYCWQIVERNASSWASADDACAAVGGRMGQPEDEATLTALAGYLKTVFSLPVLTGYVVGNAQTGEIAVVCRENRFLELANDTDKLILGKPSDEEGCVFITNDDYHMHYGPCSTAAVVLCSQPEESTDSCSVAPTCRSTSTPDYKSSTTSRTIDLGNITITTSSSGSPPTGTFTTVSTLSTTSGSAPTGVTTQPSATQPSTTSTQSGGGGSATTPTSSSKCRAGGMWIFGWCLPIWFFMLTCALFVATLICFIWACLHYLCRRCCFCCPSHDFPKTKTVADDVEMAPLAQMQTKGVQREQPKAVEAPHMGMVMLPPPVTQTTAVIPAPIPLDYSPEKPEKPETEDKGDCTSENIDRCVAGMMTDPWEAEPMVIYRDRPEPESIKTEPSVDYEKEDRMMLPPAPITARSEAPQFMESEEEDPIRHHVVAAPVPLIVRAPRRAASPPLSSPHEPFPALPRRALTDDDLPIKRQPNEKKKRTRPTLEPVVFLHNAKPEERDFMDEPDEPAHPPASRGPRAFPPPPPMSRTSTSPDARPFPEQFKSPSPASLASPGPKASRPLPSPPSPPPNEPSKRASSPPAPVVPPKQSRPLTRTPVNRPVITEQPTPSNERRSPLPPPPPPPAAKPLLSPAEPAKPRSARASPARSPTSGPRAAAAPSRARSLSPARQAPAQRSSSPFAPKKNAVSPSPQGGSLFKAAPDNNPRRSASNLRAANGKLGGVAGGHGEVPRGWKAWGGNNGTFSSTPGSDF